MSVVGILLDVEYGHIAPLLSFARAILRHGHVVAFLTPPEVGPLVEAAGFRAYEVLGRELPVGSANELLAEAGHDVDRFMDRVIKRVLPALATGSALTNVLEELRPDVLIVNSVLQLFALAVYLRHGVPVALFTVNMRLHSKLEGARIDLARLLESDTASEEMAQLIRQSTPDVRSLDQLAHVVDNLPEFTCVPEMLEVPERVPCNARYVGLSINVDPNDGDGEGAPYFGSAPLVYCSLGTQAHFRAAETQRFLSIVTVVATHFPSWCFVIVGGKAVHRCDLEPIPSNVLMRDWVNQPCVLRCATLAICHGGVGTLKECIYYGVPMLAFPMCRDHFASASQIRRHGVGVVGDFESVTCSQMRELLKETVANENIRSRVISLQHTLRRQEESCAKTDFISTLVGLTTT